MMTIEERAKETYCEYGQPKDVVASIEMKGYIKGANEQRAIDIENACDWWIKYLAYPTDSDEDRARVKEMVDEFRKAMEQ